MNNQSEKWRGFLRQLGPYVAVISMLFVINLMTNGLENPWFIWPALGWGAAIIIRFWNTFLSDNETEEHGVDEQIEQPVVTQKVQERRSRGEQPVEAVFETDREKVTNTAIQAHLNKARMYQEQISSLINATPDQHAQARLKDLGAQVDEWTQAIENLAIRVDKYQQNTLIHQDLESVPDAIEKLEARLAGETDEITRTELERTLANRKKQLAALEHLQTTMNRAEIKIESTLSALGTIYSQILTSQSTDHVADYGRLSADVDEEVRTLQDQLEALEEVKFGSVQ